MILVSSAVFLSGGGPSARSRDPGVDWASSLSSAFEEAREEEEEEQEVTGRGTAAACWRVGRAPGVGMTIGMPGTGEDICTS